MNMVTCDRCKEEWDIVFVHSNLHLFNRRVKLPSSITAVSDCPMCKENMRNTRNSEAVAALTALLEKHIDSKCNSDKDEHVINPVEGKGNVLG